jgi:serine/threonine protein kinase
MTPVLAAGTRLGRYVIDSRLGSGGMGEVYLARDTELERMVAVKVLSGEAASDRERMNRFIQEAKAASALNHPNIITIYEVSRDTPVRFIATEFIEGQTLRQRMTNLPLKTIEVLEITIQVASGLAAAHAAGIVHRDIKPENIMLRSDGYVKLLDFGLAKLTEQYFPPADGQATTLQMVKTGTGVVLGTVFYMSPEQARALPVDGRTDVWSLGVVLYEMVSGSLPFQGATATDVIVSIVEKEPLSLTSRSGEIPAELQRIIKKAIRKDKTWRYQTIADMLVDLRSLKQELEFEGRSAGVVSTDSDKNLKLLETTEVGSPNTGAVVPIRTESHAPDTISRIKSHKGKLVATLAGASLLVVVAVLKWPLSSKPSESAITSPSSSTAGLTTNKVLDEAKPFDPVAVKKEINDFLQSWAASFASHDLDAHMSSYAETLDIYNDRTNVSVDQVRAERLRDLEEYSKISLELPSIRITLDSGSRAIAIFDKTWGFYGNKRYTGSARQEVWLAKLNGRWRITGEKTLQIYDEVRQK